MESYAYLRITQNSAKLETMKNPPTFAQLSKMWLFNISIPVINQKYTMDKPLKTSDLVEVEEARHKWLQISYSLHRLSSKSKLIGGKQILWSPGTRVGGGESLVRPRGAICIDQDAHQYCGAGCTAL